MPRKACRVCGSEDHLQKKCPIPIEEARDICRKCFQKGHQKRNCPLIQSGTSPKPKPHHQGSPSPLPTTPRKHAVASIPGKSSSQPKRHHRKLRVGSFNLYNLVKKGGSYYGKKYSAQDYDKKIDWIAHQLQAMDADIVGFQEVFHREPLMEAIKKSGLYPGAQLAIEGDTGSGPVVGVLSRYPITKIESFKDFPKEAELQFGEGHNPITQFSRPVLKVSVDIHVGRPISVFVSHLKSKRPELDPGSDEHDFVLRAIGKAKSLVRRASESIALRCLLLQDLADSAKPVIALGDFNDGSESVTTEIVTGSQPWKRLPKHKKARIWDVLMYNAKTLQARKSTKDVYYTHIHNGHYESLDHILVSQEFFKGNTNGLGDVEYVRLLNDHLIDETLTSDRVPKWQSDHGQVVCVIRLHVEERDGR
eukprot:m.154373 g.154373  ORF g.154373 m.154373 type:complete len:420 (+) comp24626_c0_seq2:100-1359(+)